MLKKTIKYEDFNEEETEEECYFHLSPAELVEMEMNTTEGLEASLRQMVKEEDRAGLFQLIKTFVLSSYGKRSVNGRHFYKNPEIRDEFASSGAYNALMMELCTDEQKALQFILGIMPKQVTEEARKMGGIDPVVSSLIAVPNEEENTSNTFEKPEPQKISRKEIREMSEEEFDKLVPRLNSGEVVIEDSTESLTPPSHE